MFSNLGTDFLRQNSGAQSKNSDYLCIVYLKADNDRNPQLPIYRIQPLGILTLLLFPHPTVNDIFGQVDIMGRTQMTPQVVSTTKDIGAITTFHSVAACQVTDVWISAAQRFGRVQSIISKSGISIPSDCVDVKSNLRRLLRI